VSVVDICSASQAEVYIYLFSIHNFIFRKKRKKTFKELTSRLVDFLKVKKGLREERKGEILPNLITLSKKFSEQNSFGFANLKKEKKVLKFYF